jgi:hypothetical protein
MSLPDCSFDSVVLFHHAAPRSFGSPTGLRVEGGVSRAAARGNFCRRRQPRSFSVQATPYQRYDGARRSGHIPWAACNGRVRRHLCRNGWGHFDLWPVALPVKIHLDPDDNHPPTSDSRSIVGSSARRHTQDMKRKTSRCRRGIAELADLLFRLEYYTQLRMIKLRSEFFNAFVRGSTHIQRAMMRSAGLLSEPQSQRAVEPAIVTSNRNLTRYQGITHRQRGHAQVK